MKSFTLHSSLSKEEIYLTMRELTDSASERRLFVGTVEEDGFSVRKYQPFSNNVRNPQIDAVVTENKEGTVIYIKASLNKWDRIGFFMMGIIICAIFTFLVSNAIASTSLEPLFPALAIFVFLVLFAVASGLFFTRTVNRVVKTLKTELA